MKLKNFFLAVSVLVLLFPIACFAQEVQEIRYVAMGDSYVIGTGASPQESWPAVLTRHLREDGQNIVLVANLGNSGWATQDVIDHQLPMFKLLKPSFVTLQIGCNDWVRGVDKEVFRTNLNFILDDILSEIPKKDHVFLVTIPDFSVVPKGSEFSGGRDISSGLAEFNSVIEEEAKARDVGVVDIYQFSRTIGAHPSLISNDGLHPSAKGYAYWEKLIYARVKEIFK